MLRLLREQRRGAMAAEEFAACCKRAPAYRLHGQRRARLDHAAQQSEGRAVMVQGQRTRAVAPPPLAGREFDGLEANLEDVEKPSSSWALLVSRIPAL
jgi:hypothetical protein